MNTATKKNKNAYCPVCGALAGHTITGKRSEGKTLADRREGITRLYVCLGKPGSGTVKCGWQGTSPRWKE